MSKLLQDDEFTKKYNESTTFDPSEHSAPVDPGNGRAYYSSTSHRVTLPVYNEYTKDPSKPKVFGYFTDWAMYDARKVLIDAQGDPSDPSNWKWNSALDTTDGFKATEVGRGVDLAKIDANAYDKIILGFVGILGDTRSKADAIRNGFYAVRGRAATAADDGTISFLDVFADAQTNNNANVPFSAEFGWPGDGTPWSSFYELKDSTSKVRGLFRGLKRLQEANPDLVLSFSIGGWSMSDGFYHTARDPAKRKNFCTSIKEHLDRFPMFKEIDIDWEYPGAPGDGNNHDEDDWSYYVELLKDLKAELANTAHKDLKISIAISAVPDVMKLSHIPALIEAGVTGLNVMTYDFFGTGWADYVTHHSALKPTGLDYPPPEGEEKGQAISSVETAVNYLIEEEGIDPSMIFVGYAGYSRNAIVDSIDSVSPLEATYTKSDQPVIGSFEKGTTEWYDLIYNYLDLENPETTIGSKNGFKLYTDTVSNADFLYNKENKLFMSLDTPRSVKAKGEYVVQRKLGGLFTWTIDNDNGVLVNAAREGLGYAISKEVIDMEPMYFTGDTGEGIEPPEGDYPAPTNLKLVSSSHVSAKITFDTPAESSSGNKVVEYEGLATPKSRRISFPFAVINQTVPADIGDLVPDSEYDITVTAIYDDGTKATSLPLALKTRPAPTDWKRIEYKKGDLVYYPAPTVWQALEDHKGTFDNAPGIGNMWAKVDTKSALASRSASGKSVTLHLKESTVSGDPAGIASLVGLLNLSKK